MIYVTNKPISAKYLFEEYGECGLFNFNKDLFSAFASSFGWDTVVTNDQLNNFISFEMNGAEDQWKIIDHLLEEKDIRENILLEVGDIIKINGGYFYLSKLDTFSAIEHGRRYFIIDLKSQAISLLYPTITLLVASLFYKSAKDILPDMIYKIRGYKRKISEHESLKSYGLLYGKF